MIFKFLLYLVICNSLTAPAVASEDGPFSHCELLTRGLRAENMEFVDTPANFKISQETGIQILALKRPLPYSALKSKFTLEPVRANSDKIELANDVARFLNAMPGDFLVKNRNVCFVLVEDTQDAEAMATKNVVFLPTDASYEAMAHEFMHAIDALHDRSLNYAAWDAASGSCHYDRDVNIDRPFAGGSLDQQCFITPYAKTDLWEDRAELFSALYRNQLSASAHEPVKSKAAELKRFLQTISSSVNETFWNTRREFSW